jgi:hypothetical protein
MGTDKMIPRYTWDESFMVGFPDRCQWKDGLKTGRKRRTNLVQRSALEQAKALELGCMGYGTRWKQPWQCTTVFQAED